jgi:hypothetical protein
MEMFIYFFLFYTLLQAKKAEEDARGKPDEEGWITVGKGGRKPGASQVDAAELKDKKKKKKKVVIKD